MPRTSTCACPGRGLRDKGDKWVVLSRNERPTSSLLKCKRCGWKWKSKCLYVDRLPDHVERRIPRITDEDVLARIRDGSLYVDVRKAIVTSVGRRLTVISRQVKEGIPPYRFVVIYRIGRKKMALHRLVWMAAHMMLPPEGYDVHHKNHKRKNPDVIGNLQLVPSLVNRSHKVEEPW